MFCIFTLLIAILFVLLFVFALKESQTHCTDCKNCYGMESTTCATDGRAAYPIKKFYCKHFNKSVFDTPNCSGFKK